MYPNHKSQGDAFFNIELENTSSFCMSFIGEVATTVEATQIKNSEKQYQFDIQEGQAYWRDLSSNLSLKSDHKDIAVIQEILPWYGINAMIHVLTPHGEHEILLKDLLNSYCAQRNLPQQKRFFAYYSRIKILMEDGHNGGCLTAILILELEVHMAMFTIGVSLLWEIISKRQVM